MSAGPQAPGAATAPALCVVLHDVAPARWTACQRVLAQLQAVAAHVGVALPVTLLVVPRLHGCAETPLPYLRWLQRMHQAGHELALHGLTHRDESPPRRGLHDRLLRRVYTDSEGEFAAIDEAGARERLQRGLAWAQQHQLPMTGFVAPAWLLSAAAWRALAAQALDYTCTLTQIVRLPQRQGVAVPALVFSTRAAWRRQASLLWNRSLAWRARHAPLLRLELHPTDADHAAVRDCWSALLRQALQTRRAITLGSAAARLWPGGGVATLAPAPG